MNFPGFTAEASLNSGPTQHRMLSDARTLAGEGRIEPQSPALFAACYFACRALGIRNTIIPRDCVELCLPYLDAAPLIS